jgi:hypothetical protein
MGLRYNPFSGSFDFTRSPASYMDGEVATFADLPLDSAAAPLNSAWLVRQASGVYFLARKPAGIYIRTATGGTDRNADYTYASAFPDVFSDANFTVYDDADSTRSMQIQVADNETLTFKVTGSDSIVRSVAFPLSAILLAALMFASSALAQNIGIVTGTNGTVITGRTNTLTFSNAIIAGSTLTATGNATLNGSGNLAPSQTADSDASLMTRGIIYQSQADFNSGDLVGSQSAIAIGTGASQGAFLTFGHGVQVTTNTNTAAGVYFGDAIWSQATYSGGTMPANKAVDLTMKGVMLRAESNTNFVTRVAFGVGASTRTPPAAGNPAATNQSWGVNFFYDGTNHVYQPFWYTTNYNTAPTAVITNLTTANWLQRVYTMRFRQTTNGQIAFYINNGIASRLDPTPVWTTNVTWPSANYGGRFIGMECATATNAAPTAGARMHFRNAYIKYDP